MRTLRLALAVGSAAWASAGLPAAPHASPAPAIIAALVLLCLSAFFSASETALFSLQPVDRQSLDRAQRSAVDRLIDHPRRTLASLLIGNETVNITLSTVTAALLLQLAPRWPWLNLVVAAPLLLVFGEVLPKVMALRFNRRVAPLVARPLRLWAILITPLRLVLTWIADGFLVLTGGTAAPKKAALREAHLRDLIDRGRRAGSIGSLEQEVIHRIFEFGDLPVSRLMTPRPDIFSVNLTTPWPELVEALEKAGYSRVPVWRGTRDNIVGILLVKDLLPAILATRDGAGTPARAPTIRELMDLLHPPRFVPTTKRAEQMLKEFREEKFHMAVVVDEHGSIAGVVTLDDLLAELVGELLDEHDVEEEDVREVREGLFTVKAGIDIEDFSERFDVEIPEGDYTTLSGFLLSLLGELPEKGQELRWNGLRFTVSGIDGHRLTEISVEVVSPHDAPRDALGGEARE